VPLDDPSGGVEGGGQAHVAGRGGGQGGDDGPQGVGELDGLGGGELVDAAASVSERVGHDGGELGGIRGGHGQPSRTPVVVRTAGAGKCRTSAEDDSSCRDC